MTPSNLAQGSHQVKKTMQVSKTSGKYSNGKMEPDNLSLTALWATTLCRSSKLLRIWQVLMKFYLILSLYIALLCGHMQCSICAFQPNPLLWETCPYLELFCRFWCNYLCVCKKFFIAVLTWRFGDLNIFFTWWDPWARSKRVAIAHSQFYNLYQYKHFFTFVIAYKYGADFWQTW